MGKKNGAICLNPAVFHNLICINSANVWMVCLLPTSCRSAMFVLSAMKVDAFLLRFFVLCRSFLAVRGATDGNWRCGKLYWHPQVSFRVCDATIMVMMRHIANDSKNDTKYCSRIWQANRQIFHINANCFVERGSTGWFGYFSHFCLLIHKII